MGQNNVSFIISGYVQGMSDLLSPILVTMENEVDAFWCFAGFMEKVVSISKNNYMCVGRGSTELHVCEKRLNRTTCVWEEAQQNYMCVRRG